MSELNILEAPKQISRWTCHKLECLADFIGAYTKARETADCYYLELYAGGGSCICRSADCRIDDSQLRALKTETKFAKYVFVVRDPQDAESLKRLAAPFNTDNNVEVLTGNCISEPVIRQLFTLIPRTASRFGEQSGNGGLLR